MRPVSDGFLQAVRGPHRVAVSARICEPGQIGPDPEGQEVDVIDGSVTCDSTADVRCTVDLTVDGRGWKGADDKVLHPYGPEIFIRCGLYLGTSPEWVPLGYFRIDSVEPTQGDDSPLQIAGMDRTKALQDAKLIDAVQFQPLTTVAAAFQALVGDVMPHMPVVFDYPARSDHLDRQQVVGGSDSGDSDADRWAFLRDLATSRAKEIFFDEEGRLRVQHAPPADVPVFDIDAGPRGVLVKPSRNLNRDEVFNGVIATGEGADAKHPVRAVVLDTDPASPTMWGGPFGMVPTFYSSPNLKNDNMARGAAARLLDRSVGRRYSLDLTAAPNPALEALDPVRVRYRDGSAEVHVLDKVTFGLTAAGTWSGSCRQQRILRVRVNRG
ncbi:MAG: DUF5047 domain-containing protein [Streptosporangiales bacterium]